MTRAEARRKAKESHKAGKVYQMTHESLENTILEARKQERVKAIGHAVDHYSLALTMVLMDKWGFTEKNGNLSAILAQIGDLYDSIERGYVNAEDIRKTILEEEGLDLGRRIIAKS